MNMFRNYGVILGLVTLICDAVKGAVPCILGWWILGDEFSFSDDRFGLYLGGLCVIIGHIFPVFLKFKGGKGIASTLGMFVFALSCEKWWYFPVLVVFHFAILFYIAVTEWGSMGSLLGVSLLTIWQTALIISRYSSNLLNGWII